MNASVESAGSGSSLLNARAIPERSLNAIHAEPSISFYGNGFSSSWRYALDRRIWTFVARSAIVAPVPFLD